MPGSADLGHGGRKIRTAVKRLNESFAAWTHLTEELQAILPMTQLPGIGAALDDSACPHFRIMRRICKPR